MDAAKQISYRVLMFPWLAHGHVSPFLELAKNLCNQNFHIYFCSTPINLDSIKQTLNQDANNPPIELIELHLPSPPSLPPHYHTTKNIPPHLMPTLMHAFQSSSPSFSDILANLKPDLLIYDGFQPWAAKSASSQGIPSVAFSISGSAGLSYFHHLHTHKSFDTFPYPAIFLREFEMRGLMAAGESIKVEDKEEGFAFGMFELSSEIVLFKSCRGIEGKYMDYFTTLCRKKIVPVGPLVVTASNSDENQFSEIMDWLSKKAPNSTLYISFGSENYLSREQMGKIAKGLEISEVNFIWVARSPPGEEAASPPPDLGFIERLKSRGMVLRGWAPQAAILAHPSVGGFMSHCGWSSVTESVYFGVPVVALPLKLDQPVNCRLAVEKGVAVEVARDEKGGFAGEAVARAVNEVIVAESGERLRLKARELSETMRMEEREAIFEVAEELNKICAQKSA